jgi:hypothetical protein
MADIPRIKSNIGSMIEQGAPEADIDAYLASEGVSVQDLHAVSATDQVKDIAKSGGVGVAKGGISMLGGAGDLRDLLSKGVDYAAEKAGVSPDTVAKVKGGAARATNLGRLLADAPTSKDIQSKVEEYTGEFYKPKTTAGEYAQTVGEFLPASALGPGRMAVKLGTGALAGLGSEAAGQATEGTAAEPYARVAGALAGGLTPSIAGRAVTPLPASQARQRLVDILADEGVTSLTAGQRTGNKSLQYLEDFLGNAPGAGQGANRIRQQGQEQFTEAAMRRAGTGPDATPEVLAQNNQRLGNEFERLSARNDLIPDNQFITELTDAVNRYRRVPDSQQARMLQGYLDDIVPYVQQGTMPGVEYQPMRSMLSADSKSVRQTDPYLSRALAGIRDALDNAMGRSISPADREAWATARRQYGAQKAIEKTASRAGEATAEGQLVPANLRNTISADNRGAYARGEGQFSELARAGAGVMAPLPNSGTAQRLSLTNVAMLPVSATAGRALMSRPVQAYLGNQTLTEALQQLPPARRAALIALLNNDPALIEGPRQ